MLITVLVEIVLSQWFIWLYFTLQALNKKEHKGCESPEPGADSDPYNGLRVDDKYDHRIPDDYQRVMQQNVMRVRSYRTIWVISYSYSPCNVALVVMFVYNLLAHTLHICINIYGPSFHDVKPSSIFCLNLPLSSLPSNIHVVTWYTSTPFLKKAKDMCLLMNN